MMVTTKRTGGKAMLFVTALVASALFLSGVVYDIWVGGRLTPSLLRYVPPGSEGYVATSPLKALWSNGNAHPFFTQALTFALLGTYFKVGPGFYTDAVAVMGRIQNQCLPLNTPEDLTSVGIDATKGGAIAIIDQQNHDYAAIVPISDRTKFTRYYRELLSPVYGLKLAPTDHTRSVRNFRITSNSSSGVQFCEVPASPPNNALSPGTKVDPNGTGTDNNNSADKWPEAYFRAGSDGSGAPGRVALACAVDYADGTTGACQCKINGGADCSQGMAVSGPVAQEVEDFAVHGLPAVKSEISDVGSIYLAFPDQHTALLAMNAQSAAAALDVDNNFRAFQSDDSLRLALRQVLDTKTDGEGVVFGALALAYPPIFGSVHYSAIVTTDRVTGQVFLPWQPLEQTILNRIISTDPPPERLQTSTSQFAEIQASDPFLGYYLGYLKNYATDANERFKSYFGSFSAIIDAVESEESVSKVGLSFRGLNDGVPRFLLSINVEKQKANALILQQRRALRTARDTEILQAAAESFEADNGGMPPTNVSQILKYLDDEPDALWTHYAIKPPSQDAQANLAQPTVISAKTTDSDFGSASYDVLDNGHLLEFISPLFTSNDAKFRVTDSSVTPAEIAILESNRYRMVAYYDDGAGQLVVATDATTLNSYVGGSTDTTREQVAKNDVPQVKLRFDSNPRQLYDQIQAHPSINDGLKEMLEVLAGPLGKYNHFEASVEARPAQDGLLLSWSANHD
jgi:hypothetical protein